mmetsp:Transcript_38809/g.84081  ORF Transcript_38809/g.84081 Transcript_38809/m.84081 type:complete len:213 (+) Transcript_38809:13-651(+)
MSYLGGLWADESRALSAATCSSASCRARVSCDAVFAASAAASSLAASCLRNSSRSFCPWAISPRSARTMSSGRLGVVGTGEAGTSAAFFFASVSSSLSRSFSDCKKSTRRVASEAAMALFAALAVSCSTVVLSSASCASMSSAPSPPPSLGCAFANASFASSSSDVTLRNRLRRESTSASRHTIFSLCKPTLDSALLSLAASSSRSRLTTSS